MAHFAKLSEDNVVIQIEVVADSDAPTEEAGVTFLTNLHGWTNWKQTSYTNSFRKQYAGRGDKYDSVKDKFIRPRPYPSWSLDENDDWQPPVVEPGTGEKFPLWNETDQRWEDKDGSIWNPDTSSWS